MNETKSKFLKVRCNKCKKDQIIFGKAATRNIKCLECGSSLGSSTGGKTRLRAKVLEVLE